MGTSEPARPRHSPCWNHSSRLRVWVGLRDTGASRLQSRSDDCTTQRIVASLHFENGRLFGSWEILTLFRVLVVFQTSANPQIRRDTSLTCDRSVALELDQRSKPGLPVQGSARNVRFFFGRYAGFAGATGRRLRVSEMAGVRRCYVRVLKITQYVLKRSENSVFT